MKGLILKDIYCVKFQITLAMLIMLVPYTLSCFMLHDSEFTGSQPQFLIMGLFCIANYLCISLFSSFVLNTMDADLKSGWSRIVRTFPVSRSAIIMAKFTATCIIIGILTAYSLAFNIIGLILTPLPAEPMITIPLCMGILQACLLFPVFPLAMRFGTKVSNALYIAAEIIMVIAVVVVLTTALDCRDTENVLRLVFYAGAPVLAAVSGAVSVLCGKRILRAAAE